MSSIRVVKFESDSFSLIIGWQIDVGTVTGFQTADG